MNKSILVTNTPSKGCWSCELVKSCKVIPSNQSKEKWETTHPQCPLQDTTELLEALMLWIKSSQPMLWSEREAYNKLSKALGGKLD